MKSLELELNSIRNAMQHTAATLTGRTLHVIREEVVAFEDSNGMTSAIVGVKSCQERGGREIER